MSTPPDPFDPDDPDADPWADDPDAPKEPGLGAGVRGPAALLDPETRDRIEHEILYQQTRTALASAPPPPDPALDARAAGWQFAMFAAAVVGVGVAAGAVRPAVLLLAALAAHELGHLVGMLLFRFRDPGLFLVPFVAAAVAGKGEAASPAKRAVTVLLGPLPGLFAGAAVFAAAQPAPGTWGYDLALVLVALNGVALLPVVPFDGGRLFDLLAPTRGPAGGLAARAAVAAALGCAAAGTDWRAAVPLGALAGLVLVSAPVAHRLARSRRVLGQLLPGLPEKPDGMTDAQRRKVFDVALAVYPEPDPDRLAVVVRHLHTQASARAAGGPAAAGHLAAYALGVAAVVTFAWLAG